MTTTDIAPDVSKAIDSPPEEKDPIDDLVDFIIELANVPMSWWAVAALLESRGLRDVDAVE
ncbi:MAG: hypothetical protein AAF194_05325, partial [Pseudomonadota bacterium]